MINIFYLNQRIKMAGRELKTSKSHANSRRPNGWSGWTRMILLAVAPSLISTIGGCAKIHNEQTKTVTGDRETEKQQFSLDVTTLSAEGCLNLEQTISALRALGPEAQIRHHTQDFKLESTAGNGVRRNFRALAAISNFVYSLESSSEAFKPFLEIKQIKCSSMTIHSDLEGTREYRIIASKETASVTMISDDGTSQTWHLKDEKTLEIETVSNIIDPCPNYSTALAHRTEIYRWGSPEQIQSEPLKISRVYLRHLLTALREPLEDLEELAAQDSVDLAQLTLTSAQNLRDADADTEILHCPYRSTPPSGDEPPPQNEAI